MLTLIIDKQSFTYQLVVQRLIICLEVALKLEASPKFLESFELAKHKYVTHSVLLVKCQGLKMEGRVWQCTLIQKEHFDLNESCKLLNDFK